MLRTFPIDFIRQAFEQKLFEEHNKDLNLFGGKNQVNIFSFYEQLKSQDEVDRFVKNYRDLSEQQNRTGLILNGVIVAPENPTITNLYSSLIIPLSWTCSMRCTLANRDQAIATINNLIDKLKGRKADIAELHCVDDNGKPYAQPFMVGTIYQGDGKPTLKNGDYIGSVNSSSMVLSNLLNYFDALELSNNDTEYVYCENDKKIKVGLISVSDDQFSPTETTILDYDTDSHDYITKVYAKLKGSFQYDPSIIPLFNKNSGSVTLLFDNNSTRTVSCSVKVTKYEYVSGYPEVTVELRLKDRVKDDDLDSITSASCELYYKDYNLIEDDGSHSGIAFPPEHTSFEKYKVSFSFDAIRCDEPRTLNAEEYCELTFGGSATLVSNGVKLGNDLVKLKVSKDKIVGKTTTTFASNETYLEPLELPSGSNANTQINQLVSNKFKTNTHTDALALTLQYTFIVDENIALISQWFDYARYGIQNLTITNNVANAIAITPNIIYDVVEYWCSWGVVKAKNIKTKIVENMDIENTESDTLTLALSMQIQGDNN